MEIQIPEFNGGRVLVVGDVMLDRYWHGDASRVSPEAPVPVVRVAETEERPGGAANVALNTAALGARTRLLGIVGQDTEADSLGAMLGTAGVLHDLQRHPGSRTVTKLRVISRQQQLIRLDFEDGFQDVKTSALLPGFRDALGECDVVVLSDYGKGTLCDTTQLITAARQAGRPVLVDPCGADFSRYRGASIITPNLDEFERVAGRCRSELELTGRAAEMMARFDLAAILLTRGEHGMSLFRPGEPERHLPTRAREVFDVTGAGDTVIAMLSAALAAGEALPSAMSLANLAAGIVVGRLGTASVSVPELCRAALDAHAGCGDMNEEQLLMALAESRERGERIVMTNGCFDILHAGHVACLSKARRLGDRLVVAVNDDASVTRLKGAGRPVNPLERRMAVLSALECVDWVVPFSEDTPERLICRASPDVLVKGGDYSPGEIAGHDCVMRSGGEVVVLEYEDGCSTSDIIDRIRRQD